MRELTVAGVEFDELMPGEGPVPPMAFIKDIDGNRIILVQRDD